VRYRKPVRRQRVKKPKPIEVEKEKKMEGGKDT